MELSPGDPVYIRWVDSKALSGWQLSSAIHDVGHIETIGWVIANDKASVTISASLSKEGYSYDPFTIPKGCILDVVELGPFD